MKKKLLALLLVLSLLLTALPSGAAADAENGTENPVRATEETASAADSPAPAPEKSAAPAEPVPMADEGAKALPFTDVPEKMWYYEAVSYVYKNGIFAGVTDTRFDPMGNMTRSMFVSVLSRMAHAESTEFGTASAFSDVKSDFWYTAPINWAVAFNITAGTGNGKFSPNDPITREQVAVFFARYLRAYGVTLPDSSAVTELPRDLLNASSWARDDILTLWRTGLMIGDGIKFKPKNLCSRAECASMCMRVYSYIQEALGLKVNYDTQGKSGSDAYGARGVETDFTLKIVCSDASLTALEVLALIDAENLTDRTDRDILVAEGGNGSFTLSGRRTELGMFEPGFAPGSTYRVKLEDERLSFGDLDASVREYDFTTAEPQTMNLSLSPDLVCIPAAALKDLTQDGKAVEMIDAALFTVDGELPVSGLTKGTFRYDGALPFGTVAAVYLPGTDPEKLPGSEGFDGETAYIKIGASDGGVFTYTGAEAQDVLFVPNVLPVPVSADLNTDGKENTVQVENRILDFSDDVYANLGLDSETEPRPGDWLAFYTGSLNGGAISGYGKVLSLESAGGVTTLTFESADWETVRGAMELFSTEEISGEELVADLDAEKTETEIAERFAGSGFAAETARSLMRFALDTGTAEETVGSVLEGYSFRYEDGAPVPGMPSCGTKGAAIVGDPVIHVTVNHSTEKLAEGMRIVLNVELPIAITPAGAFGAPAMELDVRGRFVEELGISLDVTGKAEWDIWGVFPYISDYTVTGNADVRSYTGVDFNLTVKTAVNADYDFINRIANKIKYLMALADDANEDYYSEDLAVKYSAMLKEDSSFVDLFRQKILSREFHVPEQCPIIHILLGVDFVISLNAVISAGVDFGYQSAKRYVFNFSVLGHTATNDVTTLEPDVYDLTAYVMGHLELRAGISLYFDIGLISTSIDKVGFSANAGAYLDLYGYFYYQYHRVSGSDPETKWKGEMYLEIGIYLSIGFHANLKGIVSTALTIYEHSWPLWSYGYEDSVLDFATPQEQMPEISLRQYIRTAYLPDSVFAMDTMDMKTGEKNRISYDTADECDFNITMSNSKFAYDPQTNRITVNPDEKDIRLEGTMTITFRLSPLALSSRPIQRTVKLVWSNLRDGYVIMPYSNGGSFVQPVNQAYDTAVTPPADPVRTGYLFGGWYADEELTTPYVFPEKMPAEDALIYAKWNPATDTRYTVEHRLQKLGSDEYEIADTDSGTGTTDSAVTPPVRSYEGFTSPEPRQLTVTADGAAVLIYYYRRNLHKLTFDGSSAGSITSTINLYYGAAVSIPKAAAKGYSFDGWYEKPECTGEQFALTVMPDRDVTCYGKFTKDTVTKHSYRLEYYLLREDGSFELAHSETRTAPAGTVLTCEWLLGNMAYDPLTNEITKEFLGMTVNGRSVTQAEVLADDSLVIKMKYRNRPIVSCALTYRNLEGASVSGLPSSCESFSKVVLPDPVKQFCLFDGWYYDSELKNRVPDEDAAAVGTTVTVVGDTVFYAGWKDNSVRYLFYNNLGNQNTTVANLQVECGQTAVFPKLSELKADGKSVDNPGYSFEGWSTSKDGAVVYSDGATVKPSAAEAGTAVTLWAKWKIITYTITCSNTVSDSSSTLYGSKTVNYTVLDEVTLPELVPNESFQFLGWYDGDTRVTSIPKGSTGNRSLTAKWAHGGVFAVSFKSTSGKTSTFTVTREKPSGTVYTTDKQYVYYRTENGSAIGGTASAIHFLHTGGPNVYLTFAQNDTSKTFTVEQENATPVFSLDGGKTNTYATQWTYSGDRFYYVRIYDVRSASGNCTGRIGWNDLVQHSITQPAAYKLNGTLCTSTAYGLHSRANTFSCTVTDSFGFSKADGKYIYINPRDLLSSPGGYTTDDAFRNYMMQVCNSFRFYLTANIKEDDDGAQWFKFDTYTGTTLYSTGKFKYSIPGKDYNWKYGVNLPRKGTLDGVLNDETKADDISGLKYVLNNSIYELQVPGNTSHIDISFDASGDKGDDWRIGSVYGNLRVTDTREPQQVCVAPMAFGNYYDGQKVMIAVIFDEAIKDYYVKPGTAVFDWSKLTAAGLKVSVPWYVDTIGTNVMLYECMVTDDFTVDANVNAKLTTTRASLWTAYDYAD